MTGVQTCALPICGHGPSACRPSARHRRGGDRTLVRRHDRAGQGAGFIVVNCYRFFGHARKDKSPYRDEAEELEGRKKDPVLNQLATLEAANLMTHAEFTELETAANLEMDGALEFAQNSAIPALSTMFEDVYDATQPKPESVDSRLEQVLL